ncbi:MAG TPA: hypothetical protein VFA58_08020, partial [Chthoniobacterales bacterium]|nr:hypothetical protein [Chthoniobacterales bacterium]
MNPERRLIVVAVLMFATGGALGYIVGQKNSDDQLAQMIHSLAFAQKGKETASYTRLLEELHNGTPQAVTTRLEAMLDYSLIDIGILSSYHGVPNEDLKESLNRSLSLARNYRQRYP